STDPLGRLTWYTYDLLNRLSTLVDPLQGLARFTYDATGNLLTVHPWSTARSPGGVFGLTCRRPSRYARWVSVCKGKDW
ncbi:MAG: hypothetical protein H6Q86_1509, partial [candidate division NC10 bacterium]|nr:hypothetical protein [candidate division NC10 bacterium]